jgi:hypothetical protein
MNEIVERELASLPEGAMLAHDLRDKRGGLVLARGAVLTAALCENLQWLGFVTVPVVRASVLAPDDREAERARVARQVEARFRAWPQHPLMNALKQRVLEHLLREAGPC